MNGRGPIQPDPIWGRKRSPWLLTTYKSWDDYSLRTFWCNLFPECWGPRVERELGWMLLSCGHVNASKSKSLTNLRCSQQKKQMLSLCEKKWRQSKMTTLPPINYEVKNRCTSNSRYTFQKKKHVPPPRLWERKDYINSAPRKGQMWRKLPHLGANQTRFLRVFFDGGNVGGGCFLDFIIHLPPKFFGVRTPFFSKSPFHPSCVFCFCCSKKNVTNGHSDVLQPIWKNQ